MNNLKHKASAYRLSQKKTEPLLTGVIISVGQGLAGLVVPFRLLEEIRVGHLIIMWVFMWVAHDRLQQGGDGKSYPVILK